MGIRDELDKNLGERKKKVKKQIDDILSGTTDLKEYEKKYTNKLIEDQRKQYLKQLEATQLTEGANGYEEVKKPWYKQLLQMPDAFKDNLDRFDDGYQFGDILGTVGETLFDTGKVTVGTVGDVGLGALKGVAQTGEGIAKLGAGGVAQVADWIGQDDYAKKVRNNIATKEDPVSSTLGKWQDTIDDHSIIGDSGDKVSEALGYIGTIWAGGSGAAGIAGKLGATADKAAKIGSIAQTGTMFTSATGNALGEAYQKEDVTDAQAWTKAIGTGTIETATEKLFGIFGTSGLDKALANKVSSKLTSGMAKTLTRTGVQAGGEAIEELLSYSGGQLLDMAIDKVSNGKGAEFKEDWNWDEVGEQMVIAGIAAGVLGGGANISSTIENKTDTNTWTEAINESARQQDIQAINEDIENLTKKLNKETDATKKQKIQNQINEKQQQLNEIAPIDETTQEISPVESTVQDIPITENIVPNIENTNAQQITEAPVVENVENIVENEQPQAVEEQPLVQAASVQDNVISEITPQQEVISPEVTPQASVQEPQIQDVKVEENTSKQVETEKVSAKTQKMLEHLKESGTKILDTVPEGWKKVENATTAPNGYTWYSNNKSLFGGERETALVKDSNAQVETTPKEVVTNKKGLQMSVGDEVKAFNSFRGSYIVTGFHTLAGVKRVDLKATDKDYKTSMGIDMITENLSNPIQAEATTETKVEEVLKPVEKAIEKLTTKLDDLQKQIAEINTTPASQEVVEQERQANQDSLVNEEAPLDSGLSTENAQMLEEYESFINENGIESLNEQDLKQYEYLKRQQEYYEEHNTTPEGIETDAKPVDPFENRDIEEVGNRKVKAYQYENPEVRPYFLEEAKVMLNDVIHRQEGKRFPVIGQDGYIDHWTGQQRMLVEDIAKFKDDNGYSYKQIEEGLRNIIEDKGSENNAVSKRLEFVINDRLLKGYTAVDGTIIPPDQDYINFLNEKQITEYYSQSASEINDDYITPEATNELSPVISSNTSPFELTSEKQAKIQELRNEQKEWANRNKDTYSDKTIKNRAMQVSSEIRNITQGDLLIPLEGGLTESELANKIKQLKTNYVGKQVLVDNKQGEIIGNSFGKIGVKFEDGTTSYFTKDQVTPVTNIDELIKEQKEQYKQYKQQIPVEQPSITPEAPIEPQTLKVSESISPVQETAQKPNTELLDTSQQTQDEQKAAKIMTEAPKPEKQNQRMWAKTVMAVFDKGAPIEKLSLQKKNRNLMAKWDTMLVSPAKANNVMLNGVRKIDATTGTETQVTDSLDSIRTEVVNSGKTQEFYEYMYHNLNMDRMSLETKAQEKIQTLQNKYLEEAQGKSAQEVKKLQKQLEKDIKNLTETKNKPVFGDNVSAEMSKQKVQELEMENPEFIEWANKVYNYNNALRDLLVENNVISQETADLFAEMYPHYVPIGRADVQGNAINVPLDTNRTTVNTPIKRAKGGNQDILPLFDTMAKRTFQTYKAIDKNNFGIELKNTLNGTVESQETNIDEVLDNVDQQEGLLQEGKNGKAPTFTVFEKGQKVTYEITQEMYEALKPVSDSSLLSTTFKPFNKISNFHRGLLTEYNPVFMFTNGIKDFQDILLNSQHSAKTYAKLPEAYKQIAQKGMWYREYMANGGEHNSYFDTQENSFDTERKGISKVLDLPPLKQISQLNNFLEMSPRLAEYIASRESGRSIEVSMLDAARVTTNFKAGGDLTKWANRNGATFLNASIQGAMQQVRNVREAHSNGLKGYANLASKFALAGLPAMILNSLMWDDDEEYEELSDYVKQNYYIVGKYGDGNFIRIPKGRMITVVQEGLNQMTNLVTGNDEADLGKFLEIVGNNIAPNNPIENNVLSPIIGAATNTTWYGDDLVPTRLQDEPVTEQYDETTDKFSIFLGQKLGISPYKINYVLDQYSGGVGDVVLPMLTQEAETGTDDIGSKILAPLTSKFTVDSVMKNQNVSDLYSKSEELTSQANSVTATDEDILKNKYLNGVKTEMNLLYKEKREIQNSDLPDSEKYEQVRNIQKEINEMAKNALDNYETVEKTSNYAAIGDKEYYLKNDTWTKVDDEELTELNDLNMDINDKTTYFDLKSKISSIKESSIENKKSEIAIAVKNTNLTDEQKAYVYGKNYSSDDTLDMIIKSNIPFNDYLDYASQEFVADKDEDGKTISGSRRDKIISYVNSMNLSIPQKAMLIRKEYSTFRDYNEDIISYVDSLNISYEEKVKMLTDLDMKVNLDGSISWD